ncbi:maltose/maltodextrin ABC transporter substrate-binding protein MalE [Chitinimonas viridis]|uniref:Maltodextrin-binding protein n=1 Tax=Chitinimonas viridis TaxID=664880 RepID=A0ABT8BBW6_9NEIS|nr:maltose/maltodextrin ABC transporter substrate-binding protein MalE [Chitinimonas viridis]MDN3578954.1 maltose/maltodextrin ABC transporter substrate-binding protein MalE [Chitinimonas viridis]
MTIRSNGVAGILAPQECPVAVSPRRIVLKTLLGIAASACLLSPAMAAGKQLTVWINGDKGYEGIEKIGKLYTKQTGITVKVEHPDDAPTRFQQEALAGNGPDIWIWPHDRIGEWIKLGLLTPINPTEEARRNIVSVAWDAFTVGGKTWGYPLSVETVSLIYNKALIKNPPKSFEEIPALDAQLQKRGARAILWDYNNTYFTWPLMAANGGYPFFRDIKGNYDARDTGVAKPGAVAGLETLAMLINKGVMPKGASYGQMEEAMRNGKLGMMISGPWAWEGLREAKINFGVAPIPSVKGKPSRPFVGVLGAMINAKSRNKKEALAFLEQHLLKLVGLKAMNEAVPLGVPADITLFWQLYNDENIRNSMDNIHLGKPMPSNPEMGKFWAAMATALPQVTDGNVKPQEAMVTAAKQIAAPM